MPKGLLASKHLCVICYKKIHFWQRKVDVLIYGLYTPSSTTQEIAHQSCWQRVPYYLQEKRHKEELNEKKVRRNSSLLLMAVILAGRIAIFKGKVNSYDFTEQELNDLAELWIQ